MYCKFSSHSEFLAKPLFCIYVSLTCLALPSWQPENNILFIGFCSFLEQLKTKFLVNYGSFFLRWIVVCRSLSVLQQPSSRGCCFRCPTEITASAQHRSHHQINNVEGAAGPLPWLLRGAQRTRQHSPSGRRRISARF